MTSNHLDITSVWKSLVASCVCVCVAEVRTSVFNTFVSSAKCVHLQHKNCFFLSPAQNVFVAIQLKLLFTISVVRDRLLFMTEISCTDHCVQRRLCGERLPGM